MKPWAISELMQNAATGTGDGTALPVDGLSVASVQVAISSTATVTFEALVSGSTWVAVNAVNANTGAVGTTATASGLYTVLVAGFAQLRARISSFGSGTITVYGLAVTGGRAALMLGQAVMAASQPVTIASNQSDLPANLKPATSGGCATYRSLGVQNTGLLIKASAGQIYHITAFNSNAAARYLKFYDKATAPTVGTDTPLCTYPLGGSAPREIAVENGIQFVNGIGVGATTALADNDTGNPGANDVILVVDYK